MDYQDHIHFGAPTASEHHSDHEPTPGSISRPITAVAEQVPAEAPVDPAPHENGDWHAEAGRKGAYRIRELIRYGRLYDAEHGLKSGRQRLRQLIEEGKRYEAEHGLRPEGNHGSRQRRPRMSKRELLTTFLHSVVRLAKPSLRTELLQLLNDLERPEQR